ncbi:MAG: hypothetical protein L3J30_04050 [Marinosulfonomonas sp.]|nr:hypothetical protein [Marinosulfonomonas sp.]
MTDFFIETKPAKNCAEGHISEFVTLVNKGDEVDAQGLRQRVKASHLLTFARLDGVLVGIAVICPAETKNPRSWAAGVILRRPKSPYSFVFPTQKV